MLLKDRRKRRWPWLLLIVPAVLALVVSAGTFVYIHFIAPDPAPRLTFSSVTPSTSASSAAAGSDATVGSSAGTVDGTWKVSDGSQAGYRVSEVLNGQTNEATGRTTAVTGQLVISGTSVGSATFSVDLTKISSGESQRDSQFRGRIMNTSQYPMATFELTAPIELSSVPANLVEISVKATGTLTLHGTSKAVTIDLTARRNGANLEITGAVPITFSDYGISNPSGGPATVGNAGEMEVLLVLTRA